jgi:hypothetical protein
MLTSTEVGTTFDLDLATDIRVAEANRVSREPIIV